MIAELLTTKLIWEMKALFHVSSADCIEDPEQTKWYFWIVLNSDRGL